MAQLDVEIARLNQNFNNILLLWQQIYQGMQAKESDKIPDNWDPLTINLHSPGTLIIVNRNHRRQSVSIQNQGPSAVLLGNEDFHGAATVANVNNMAPNSSIGVSVCQAGSSFNMATKGPVFAYSVNYGVGTNENCVLSIIETLFVVPTFPFPPAFDGLQFSGVLEGNEELGVGGLH